MQLQQIEVGVEMEVGNKILPKKLIFSKTRPGHAQPVRREVLQQNCWQNKLQYLVETRKQTGQGGKRQEKSTEQHQDHLFDSDWNPVRIQEEQGQHVSKIQSWEKWVPEGDECYWNYFITYVEFLLNLRWKSLKVYWRFPLKISRGDFHFTNDFAQSY